MGWLFAMTIPGLAVGLVVVAAVELALRRRRRSRGGPAAGTVGATGFDELTALMYAGKRAELDQRATATLLRDEQGDADPLRVDPVTGRASVRVPRSP